MFLVNWLVTDCQSRSKSVDWWVSVLVSPLINRIVTLLVTESVGCSVKSVCQHVPSYSVSHCDLVSHIKVKVKQSRSRPGLAQRVPGSYDSQISWQRHRMVVRLSALRTGRLYTQEIHLLLISVRGWVDPRAIVRPEGINNRKIPMTSSGIETATCRFVA
jgi:hypothetical protein